MQRPINQRIVLIALMLLTLWPALHIGLVHARGLSPWKLSGWGMYALPRPKFFGMEVYVDRGTGSFEQMFAPTPDVRDAATTFLERQKWLGELASIAPLARALRASDPSIGAIRLEVFRPELDNETAMVTMRTVRYSDPP